MDTATVVDLGRQALWMTVLISAPLLGIALFVGLFIGILQAATSINEATLSFIPKLAALAITLAVVGGWQITTLVDYTRALFQRIPGLFTGYGHRIHRTNGPLLWSTLADVANIGPVGGRAHFFTASAQFAHSHCAGHGHHLVGLPYA